ncbi:MAG: hemerythrin domain-containing protein, partial [gamma proteobacterium endosymbiont of Lamellibrachia anaximandri]|nr:hemerythrin domain-containing protein [gamma proteobacterium endosymbiont of Lamellibrachia anaximandri]
WTPRSDAYFASPLAQGTPGKQCGLAATGDYQPSLRSPWLAAMEEEVLFPAFEEVTGMAMGPTVVMRGEHAQMRDLFQEMTESVEAKDQDRYLGLSDTLLVVMQQHNAKEEQMLYQMSDQVLGGQASELLSRMEAID